MGQQMLSADELRSVAVYLEEAAANPTDPVDTAPTLEIGDAQNFPREAPTERAVGQGLAVSQEEARKFGALLLELAAILDAGGEVTPVMLAPVQPYVDTYQRSTGEARGQAEPKVDTIGA